MALGARRQGGVTPATRSVPPPRQMYSIIQYSGAIDEGSMPKARPENMTTNAINAEYKALAIQLDPIANRRADLKRELNRRVKTTAIEERVALMDENTREAFRIALDNA